MKTSNRVFGLDVIRSISIFLVLLSHSFFIEVFELGVLGVEIFFVLSGFLIGQILIRDFTNGISLSKITDFWKRRWFRTLPMYYLILLFKFILDHSLGYKAIVYLFFLQNNFVGITLFPISWSLVIEEWFYLTLPIFIFFVFRKGFTKTKFSWFLIAIIIGELLLRTGWVLYSNRNYEAIRGNFPFRFDSLVFGVLLAHIKLNYKEVYQKLTSFLVFLPATVVVLALSIALGKLGGYNSYANSVVWTRTIWFTLTSMSIVFTIPFFERNTFVNGLAKYKILFLFFTWTSIFTYGIYLIHFDVFHIPLPDVIINNVFFKTIVQYAMVYAIAATLYFTFESRMTKLRDRK